VCVCVCGCDLSMGGMMGYNLESRFNKSNLIDSLQFYWQIFCLKDLAIMNSL
jgi:hypothetical protein